MRPIKQAVLYIATLLVGGVAILGMLHIGASLPVPRNVIASAAHTVRAPVQRATASTSLVDEIQNNLGHPLSQLFIQLLVVIVATRLTGHAFTRVGMPAVVGEMAAGILLGPSLLGWIAPNVFALVFPAESLGALKLLSQIGICLFMFAVGMETSVRQVRSMAQCAVAVSHTSIIFPFLLGVALAFPLFSDMAGDRATFTTFALFVGISMSITAFPVLARILQERGLANTRLGNTAIACAAVEDVTAWTIMGFVVAVARSGGVGSMMLTLLLVILFIAVMSFGARRMLLHWISPEHLMAEEPSSRTLTVMSCVAIAASFSTEVLGIHALFGAFLAGAIMPDVGTFRHRIGVRVGKFSATILLPLFFAFTGLRTQISLLGDFYGWLVCLLIIATATVGKLGAGAMAARLSGMGWRQSFQLGALMNTRGLMELIALNIAYDLGILSQRIFTMLVIMALVTTLMTGPLLTLFGGQRATASEQGEPSPT